MSAGQRHPKQAAVGAGVLVIAALLAAGATQIGGDAGYGGVGPNFLAWVVSALLAACGVGLLREALAGGFRSMSESDSGDEPAYWPGFAWVSAGILLNAALITKIGFILSCALCFMFAVRGFKGSQGQRDNGVGSWLRDAAIGIAIAGPVYWMFTQALAINLPGLTSTGWL